MIELLLQAERALSVGLLDRAETLYRQVANADPRNSIAVVGLARVTLDRGDEVGALALSRRALEIDPENDAAIRLTARLEEVLDYRFDAVAALGLDEPAAEPEPEPEPGPEDETAPEPGSEPEPAAGPEPAPEPEAEAVAEPHSGERAAVAESADPSETEATPVAGPESMSEPEPDTVHEPARVPRPARRRSFLDRFFRRP